MNWIVFAIVAYVCLALQEGLRPLLSIGTASPCLLIVLAVYVGLHASSATVVWAWLALGVCIDLTSTTVPGIVGPAAVGYLAGAFAVIQLRTLVFRESVVTLAALVLVCGIFVELVVVAMYTLRGVGFLTGEPIPGWDGSDQLVHRFLVLVYSAVAAVPLGPVLFRVGPFMGFHAKPAR